MSKLSAAAAAGVVLNSWSHSFFFLSQSPKVMLMTWQLWETRDEKVRIVEKEKSFCLLKFAYKCIIFSHLST